MINILQKHINDMNVFVDTSALISLLDADEHTHDLACRLFSELLNKKANLITTNYVIVETYALTQRRFGLKAVKILNDNIIPLIKIEWITEASHQSALNTLICANRKKLSLVDCISFVVMQRLSLTIAFTFDKHFNQHGFKCVPYPEKR